MYNVMVKIVPMMVLFCHLIVFFAKYLTSGVERSDYRLPYPYW